MAGFNLCSVCKLSAATLATLLFLLDDAHGFVGTSLGLPKFSLNKVSQCSRPLAARLPLRNRLAEAKSPFALSMADSSATSDTSNTAGKKKVLILSWFYAQPKELELVRRIYTKKGYDVQIHESRVDEVARPRGWYNTYKRYVKGDGISQDLSDKIYQDWDVVHAMSGGFLNLALILAPVSKKISFKKLVLDSTPILPNPVSFVRFARAYMQENGLEWANKILPERVQTGYQTARWSLGAAYVRSKHKLKGKFTPKRWLGMMPAETVMEMEEWTRWASHNSMMNRYEDMSVRSIESIFQAQGLKSVTFLFNPKDPYLNQDDVKRCIDFATDEGLEINIVHSPCNHIETVFRKPKTGYQTARWSLGAAYVRSKHKLKGKFTPKRWLGMMPAETVMEMEEWTRWASHNSMMNRYEDMSVRSIESIFQAQGLKSVTFLFNPKDPYLNQDDVKRCIDFATDEGLEINIVHSPCNHIETVFRKPKLLFDALAKEPAAVGAAQGASE